MLAMNTKPPNRTVWRVGELAKAAGVSTDTLRHYERKGLLRPQRSRNGYREYPEHALERVRMIRQALAVGFTLDELSTVFKTFDGGGVPCQQVRSLAASKLANIESHLQDVIAMRNELRESLKDWDARLAKTASGQRAGLLKALAARDTVRHSSTNLLLRKPKLKQKGKKNV
jgi:DNA-binding transcriptional MerR regulator